MAVALQVVLSIILLGILLVPLLAWVRKVKYRAALLADQRYASQVILRRDDWAEFMGQRGSENVRVRGNGALVLTSSELWFARAVPLREFTIPLRQIRTVEMLTSFHGKINVGFPALVVRYEENGQINEAAWCLKDVRRWKEELEGQLHRHY